MQQIVNIDGVLHPPEEAKVSVFDHGFLFGDSIYETLRTYRRKPFLMDRHLRRLENSARMLRLKLPLSTPDLEHEVKRSIEATTNDECYIRMIITRGKGKIGLDIDLSDKPSFVIIVERLGPLPAEYYTRGIKLVIVSIRRNDQAALNPKMKSSNLLNNVLAYIEAKEQGAYEGVLLNPEGNVAECTGSNIFIVRDEILQTPPSEAGLLEGVTRGLTLELAGQGRIPFAERNVTRQELLEAQECFITSTTKEIMPVYSIHDTVLAAPGPITQELMRGYRRFVESQ